MENVLVKSKPNGTSKNGQINKGLKQISFLVTTEEANRYDNLSATDKDFFNRLVADWLQEDSWSFKTSMEFVSFRAQKRGLTPEILAQILQEENP